jgi:hypothetical protein
MSYDPYDRFSQPYEEPEPGPGDRCDGCGEPTWEGELVKVEGDWVWLCPKCRERS